MAGTGKSYEVESFPTGHGSKFRTRDVGNLLTLVHFDNHQHLSTSWGYWGLPKNLLSILHKSHEYGHGGQVGRRFKFPNTLVVLATGDKVLQSSILYRMHRAQNQSDNSEE